MTTTETRPHYDQEYGTHSPYQEPEKKSHLFLVLVLIVLALLIIGGVTLLSRRTQYKTLASETEKMAVPSVQVIHPTVEPGQEDLVLPSTTQAYIDSPIYARTSGYLVRWYHDIGSRVKKGELLADIDTPEVDQQLSQAKADLGTSKANEDLSKITATRFQELIKTDGVSKQEVDNAVGDYAAKRPRRLHPKPTFAGSKNSNPLSTSMHHSAACSRSETSIPATLSTLATAVPRNPSSISRRPIRFAPTCAFPKSTLQKFALASLRHSNSCNIPGAASKAK